ncbi:MAG: hypothetical protein ACRD2F_12030 [Terriglobales bacterium]
MSAMLLASAAAGAAAPSPGAGLALAYKPAHTAQMGGAAVRDPVVEITNHGNRGLVALELVATDAVGRVASIRFMDRLISPPHRALLPGDTMAVQVPFRKGVNPATLNPKIVAALFADGSAFGDPAEVAELRSRRKCMRQEAAALQAELQRDLATLAPRATILSRLAADEQAASATGDRQCRDGSRYAVVVAEAGVRNDRIDGTIPPPRQIMPYVLRALGRVRGWARPLP